MDEVIKSEFGNFETFVTEGEMRDVWSISPYGNKRITFHDIYTEELVKLLNGTIPVQVGCNVAAQATTNLDFWQAYQAMRRGERVRNDDPRLNTRPHHYELRENEVYYVNKDGDGYTVNFKPIHLNSTTWYIVPKGPRYKVGDRFEDNHDVVREIVYVDSITGDYCVKIIVEGKTTGIQCCSCAYLDTLTKLPS